MLARITNAASLKTLVFCAIRIYVSAENASPPTTFLLRFHAGRKSHSAVRNAENLAFALSTGSRCFGKRLSAEDSADGYSARKATVGATSQARRAGK